MHYYKKNLGDYYTKAGRLSMLQHGAYTLLMDSCYDRERFPTEEEAIEWCWAFSDEEIQAVKFVLKRFFTLQEDGTYIQKRIADEIDEYRSMADKNQKIAIEREAKKRESLKKSVKAEVETKPSSTENVGENPEIQDNENSTCMLEARHVHDPCTDGHLTINHKPLTNNSTNKSSVYSKEEVSETEQTHTLPESFAVFREKSLMQANGTNLVSQNPVQATRKGALCIKFRSMGINAAPHMPAWKELLDKYTDEEIIGCAELARERKPGERIHLNYLLAMIRDSCAIRASPSSSKSEKSGVHPQKLTDPVGFVLRGGMNAKNASKGENHECSNTVESTARVIEVG